MSNERGDIEKKSGRGQSNQDNNRVEFIFYSRYHRNNRVSLVDITIFNVEAIIVGKKKITVCLSDTNVLAFQFSITKHSKTIPKIVISINSCFRVHH